MEKRKRIPKSGIKQRLPAFTAASLGNLSFKQDYGLKYAYVTGGMYRGIASTEMVVRLGKAGFMGFFGTGGLELTEVEQAIQKIQRELDNRRAYGMNLVANPLAPEQEERFVELFLKYRVPVVEAAAFMQITPALVRFRAAGLGRNKNGDITVRHRIIAKVSRPEVAEQFLSPAPAGLVKKLRQAGKLTALEEEWLAEVPVADDLLVEADSGGHTDQGMAYTLIPAMLALRDEMMAKYRYKREIRLGAAGGIGTPEAAAAAFILGADFILTGSINQCTAEASTSEAVKDLLQQINVQDTDYAPAADMFEMGARVQVLKRGVFFPARANKLLELYRHHDSIDEMDEKTKIQLQEKYFQRSFEEIFQEAKAFYSAEEIGRAERNPKHKMALIFRWYLGNASRLALEGVGDRRVDFQVQCGPALGAFNQWVKGTRLENWRQRHVDEIGERLMKGAAEVLNRRFQLMLNGSG